VFVTVIVIVVGVVGMKTRVVGVGGVGVSDGVVFVRARTHIAHLQSERPARGF
jgi:hypothetical protein